MLNGAVPSFDLGDAGMLPVIARFCVVAGLFSLFGTMLFQLLVLPRALERVGKEPLRRLRDGSAVFSLLALFLWLAVQTADFAGPGDPGTIAAMMPRIAWTTMFGQVVLVQLVTVAAGVSLARFRPALATIIAGLAVAFEAGHAHALASAGISLLLVSDIGHLLAGGAWLGGLIPLLIVLRAAPTNAGQAVARRFSWLGTAAVVLLAITAGYQGWYLVGSVAGLAGSAYGWAVAAKLVLLLALLGIAAVNRWRLVPALSESDGSTARQRLMLNIAVETGLGLAVVFAAAMLGSLPPSIHVQPVWPFTARPGLDTLREDPTLTPEVALAILALAGALLAAAIGCLARRWRWPAFAVAAMVAGLASPHLSLLLLPAYPTSFAQSPTGFTAAAITAGAVLYPQQCASCHGAGGKGDGPLAATLPVPPVDLTAPHLWGHTDGELYWWLANGIPAPDGSPAMPGFAGALSTDQIWQMIDYIRARNGGDAYASNGTFPVPIRAPDFAPLCPSGARASLRSFRGGVVRLWFRAAPDDHVAALPPESGVVTIAVDRSDTGPAPSGTEPCVAHDPALWQAYGATLGRTADELTGQQVLIDPAGWLRGTLPQGLLATTENDPAKLLAAVQSICSHPLADPEVHHVHHL